MHLEPIENAAEVSYGDIVVIKRSLGTVMGRIESNARGVALRDWTPDDVNDWLEQFSNLPMRLRTKLQGRTGRILLQAPELLKDVLSPVDALQLKQVLNSKFSFERLAPDAYLGSREVSLRTALPRHSGGVMAVSGSKSRACSGLCVYCL